MISSNSYDPDEARNGSQVRFERCPVCKGSGIDPASQRSHQADEWDCVNCGGYGDLEIPFYKVAHIDFTEDESVRQVEFVKAPDDDIDW